MKEREITNNKLEQLFGNIIEQAPLVTEEQVNEILIGIPTANQGNALKRIFQNRLNTILLSATIAVVALTAALIWFNTTEKSEVPIVENNPQINITVPVSVDTVESEIVVIDVSPKTITIEETKTDTSVVEDTETKNTVTAVSPVVVQTDTITLKDVYKNLEKRPQLFTVPADRDTTITCVEGTTISIKSNTFVNENTGEAVTGFVDVAVKEYYKISDIVLANLTTTSGKRILESGGMLHVAATSNNENCVIKPGETVGIGFSYTDKKADMQLFFGEQTDNRMEWELDQSPAEVAIQDELIIEDTEVATRREEVEEEIKIFAIVEEMPVFPGGENTMKKYIQERAYYPFSELDKPVSGKVFVRFVIDNEGNTRDIYVLRGVNETLDKLAAYIVSNMPKWRPGKQRGQAVNLQRTISVDFNPKDEEMTDEEIEKAKKLDEELNSFEFDIYRNSYHAERKKFEEKVKDNSFNEVTISEVNQYFFNSAQLGWINCDRFYRYSNPAVNFFIRTDNTDKIIVNAIFHRFKAMLQGKVQAGRILFDRIPDGEKITFVAIKTENNQIYLAVKEIEVTENGEMELDFQPVTLELLKKEMLKLNELY